MITIYSIDSEGRLFTDPNQHFYIDAAMLREKAVAIKTQVILDRIAKILGFRSYDELSTSARCSGVTENVLMNWILSGTINDNLCH